MSNMFCFAADCILGEESRTSPAGSNEQYTIWPTDPRDWYDIRTELPYMAEICLDTCTDSIGKELIRYIRRHLEYTEEIELWRLWMGEEDYKIRWYGISIDELTPKDLRILYSMPDLYSMNTHYPDGVILPSERPVQHCLIITREPCQWDGHGVKNWRDLYPAI